MNVFKALALVAVLAGLAAAAAGIPAMGPILGIVLPYGAVAVFLAGIVRRIVCWARSPVPFRITTVCGQQRSLPFLKHQRLESPFTGWQVAGRMALEILLFRSLFRNTRTELTGRKKLAYLPSKALWAGALAFHVGFFVVLFRHLRFFLEPVPSCVRFAGTVDGMFQLLVPALLLTDVLILGGLLYLLGRRLLDPRLRYLSLPADYFVLFLLLGIAGTGVAMRYVWKVDLIAVKELTMGLATFHPAVPSGVGALFWVHLVLVSALFAYLPFSKLVHMGGVFLSPTRNLANDSRARRHVNPWNRPVDVHTYEEWEEEFRDKLAACGLLPEGE